MKRSPVREKVKRGVFELCGNSAPGPDGFSELFFQECWETVAEDVTMIVKAFFCGQKIPMYVSHTKLVLIPKKEVPKIFSDMRPISLNSFINKVISRVITTGWLTFYLR